MSNEYEDTSLLLGMIPYSLRKPEQVAQWEKAGASPTYKLLRQPKNLEELTDDCKHGLAIWRENKTLTYVTPPGSDDFPDRSRSSLSRFSLSMLFGSEGTALFICGYSDNAISETAAFFMNLAEQRSDVFYLKGIVEPWSCFFDFCGAGPKCFTLLQRGCVPSLIVKDLALSVEQSRALASQPNCMRMRISCCKFEDEGKAFVDELEKRQSPIGLKLDGELFFDEVNLRRLFKLNVFNHLVLPYLRDDLALQSFSAHAESLVTRISLRSMSVEDFSTLSIKTKYLTLNIKQFFEEAFPTELMISFWRRLSELGHFVELRVAIILFSEDVEKTPIPIAAPLMKEMIRAIMANRNLQILDLSTYNRDLEWRPHMEALFNSLKDHKELRILRLQVDDESQDFGPGMCHLRNLLWQKRDITVKNCEGDIFTDNKLICALYSLNRLYRGSARLVGPPTPDRFSLVTTALLKSTAQSFQRSSLLLADHLEVLHELVQSVQLDHDVPFFQPNRKKKRRRRI
ncbi:hypothetical protein FisN_26Lh146 [Fistulifera solaris]|uniref:Uncharacterized protein n=1 Tax=Fistulifera solaris TaxID=1519565 RepID=A0A1Z5K4Q0_FISSO|nr:hypothetical protein FisN_26Lh146 [Fistulifera solaris]|eukprot:GAX21196.1 hypothetical protein FisN_26Lh146 [Fistulifera solaris]